MARFIGTFRQASPGRDSYVRIFASNKEKAMEMFAAAYPNDWAMVYDDEKDAGVEEYKLRLTRF